jgi:hypothetical protein
VREGPLAPRFFAGNLGARPARRSSPLRLGVWSRCLGPPGWWAWAGFRMGPGRLVATGFSECGGAATAFLRRRTGWITARTGWITAKWSARDVNYMGTERSLTQFTLQNMGLISEIISVPRSMDCLEQISLPGQTGQVVVSTAGNRTAIHRAARAGQLRKLAT